MTDHSGPAPVPDKRVLRTTRRLSFFCALAGLAVLIGGFIVLSTFAWTSIARITRGSVMSAKNEEFVTAAKATGASRWRILLSHIIPNSMAPIIVYATVALGSFIVAEASLSFIGAGIKSVNTPTWGNMLSEGKELLLSGHWWPTFFPGLLILITTLCLNVLSEGLTDAMASPRIKAKPDVQADEEAMEAQETLNAWDDAADGFFLVAFFLVATAAFSLEPAVSFTP